LEKKLDDLGDKTYMGW